jgi:streptomycin 6-kinase
LRRSEPQLDRYLSAWALETAGQLIETHTSWLLPVRHIHSPAMLKLLKPDSDEHAGTALLRYFAGIGAVRLLADDAGALLMERADSEPSLVALAVSGHDDAAAAILAECIAQLHARRTHPPPQGLISLRDWFHALFALETQTPLLARCAAVARHLLATERETTTLHGDLHHDNVLPSPRGWLAIDPKGLRGERTYEVANLLCNPQPHGDIVHHPDRMRRHAALYSERLGLDPLRVLGFALAHAGLSAAWSLEDGRDPTFRLRCAAVLDLLVD